MTLPAIGSDAWPPYTPPPLVPAVFSEKMQLVMAGDAARSHIPRSIQKAKEKRGLMESIYQKTGDIEAAVNELLVHFAAENEDNLIPPDLFREVYRQMVRHIAEALEA